MSIEQIKFGDNQMHSLIFKISNLIKSNSFNKEILQAKTMIEQLRVINKYTASNI